jgi:DNA polymerase-3 subunit delta'
MTFSSLLGNDGAKSFLTSASLQTNAPQVFLLTGPPGVGKGSFALAFAMHLLGNKHIPKIQSFSHPDVLHFRPEGKTYMHPIASIRTLLEDASFPPFEASLKIFIIEDVERMLPSSSNALLKTLEEPHAHCRFLLVSSHPEEVLPTIASRSCHVPFYSIPEEMLAQYLSKEKELPLEKAFQVALASHGSFSKAIRLISSLEDPVRKGFLELLQRHFLMPPSLAFVEQLGSWEKLLEKKMDGQEESALLQVFDPLLEDLLFWLRDLHLLKAAPSSALFHSSFQEDLSRQSLNKKLPSLEACALSVEEARLALQRSMKAKTVLERLFYRLYMRE